MIGAEGGSRTRTNGLRQSRDRRKTLYQRKRRQDPFQPPVRQAKRPAQNPGSSVGKRVGTDSVEWHGRPARDSRRKMRGATISLTQMDDSHGCRANSPESMTTSRAAPVMFTPGI